MTNQQEHPRGRDDRKHKAEDQKGKRQERNEHRRGRGGALGSGDAREQADQEEFDRGGHKGGHSRDQAR